MGTNGLWVPNSALDAPERTRRCLTCGLKFPLDQRQQWRRHVVACDRKNPEVAEAQLDAIERSPFRSTPDKEKRDWISKRRAEGKDDGLGGVT